MASVKKVVVHGNTRWQVRWRNPEGSYGKKNFETAREAHDHRKTVEHDLRSGTYVDQRAAKVSFRDYAEDWRAAQPHRPNTAKRIKAELHCHIYPTFGDRPVGAVRPSEVQAFIGTLSAKRRPGTVKNAVRTLSAVFAAAVLDGLRPTNPCARAKLPRVDREQVVPLTVEQVEAITAQLPHRYRAVAVVAAGTGMRQGEVFGLRVRDVEFLKHSIWVRQQRQPIGGEGPLKGRSSYRAIPIGEVVTKALAAHLAAFPARPDEYIFRTESGEAMHRDLFRWTWDRAVKRAGANGAGMHDLRHFYASVLIAAGRSPKEVAERLGHADASLTLNVYSHLWPDDDDGTRGAIDDAFGVVPQARPESGSLRSLRRSAAQ